MRTHWRTFAVQNWSGAVSGKRDKGRLPELCAADQIDAERLQPGGQCRTAPDPSMYPRKPDITRDWETASTCRPEWAPKNWDQAKTMLHVGITSSNTMASSSYRGQGSPAGIRRRRHGCACSPDRTLVRWAAADARFRALGRDEI